MPGTEHVAGTLAASEPLASADHSRFSSGSKTSQPLRTLWAPAARLRPCVGCPDLPRSSALDTHDPATSLAGPMVGGMRPNSVMTAPASPMVSAAVTAPAQVLGKDELEPPRSPT